MPYDNLTKRLWECASGECFNCSQYTETTNASVCSKELMKQVADAIEELSKPRWIPVTERVPGIDDGDWVLGVVNGFAYGIVYKNAIVTVEYYENSGCWSLHDLDAKVAVTHWMPLPEPPEEVTQDD